jgi:hypothetical protein
MHDVREIVFGVDEELREKYAKFFVRKGFSGGAKLKCKRCIAVQFLSEDETVKSLLEGTPQHCGFPMEMEPII